MSRGMKTCMIIGCILLVAGIAVTGVCVARGENVLGFVRYLGDRHVFGISRSADIVDFEVPQGMLEGITSLEAEIAVGDVSITAGERPSFKAYGFPEGALHFELRGTALRVWDDSDGKEIFGINAQRTVEIVMPFEGLDRFEIDLGVGNTVINGMATGAFSADLGTGNLDAEGVKAESFKVSMGVGDFVGAALDCESASVEVGVGNLGFSGVLERLGTFSVGTGDADVALDTQDVYVTCSSGIGAASINDNHADGMGGDLSWGSRDAGCSVSVEAGLGNARVEF